MTAIAPHVTAFFRERLTMERRASIHTCDSYAYAFKLLLGYASKRLKVAPSRLELEQIDAPLVVAFLNDLETARSNGASSRNVRLAAIKSFYALHGVSCAVGVGADSTYPRNSIEKDRYTLGTTPLIQGDSGALGCTKPRRLVRNPRPRHAAHMLRCRVACFRTHRSPSRRSLPASPSQHSRTWQRAQGTMLAFMETDSSGATSMARCSGNCSGTRTVRQRAP